VSTAHQRLTRGWVCCLRLLLVLASAVTLRSESCGTHDCILLSQIRDTLNLEGQVAVCIPPRLGWPNYTPRHWVLFSSPPTTRRSTVKVFDPASTRAHSTIAIASRYTTLARTAQKTACNGTCVSLVQSFPSLTQHKFI
jgi:hypothetical protein